MAYNSENLQTLTQTLDSVGELVGSRKVVNGMEMGLDMELQRENCLDMAQTVRSGLFKVVIMGTFSSGKSTLINAMLGAKVLPESINPCTSVLTFIQYGEKKNIAEVHYKSTTDNQGKKISGKVVEMPINEFYEEYKYTEEDEEECRKTSHVQRFSMIDYAIVYSTLDLMKNGVRIIDSPGLEDKGTATNLTLNIAEKAQAIIYLGSERGYAEGDRNYFKDNFRNCPNNVFFVINKIDLVVQNVEKEKLMSKVRKDVESVFTKEDGSIDTELMNRRIFGVAALLALDARRGLAFDKEEQKDVPINDEKRKRKIEISCFEGFERELETFLTTDEKCVAQYYSAFNTLSSTFVAAEQRVAENMAVYDKNRQFSQSEIDECSKLVENIDDNIKITESQFDACSLKLQSDFADIIRASTSSIDRTWEQDLQVIRQKISFGMKEYLGIALNNINIFASKDKREQNMKKFMEPFSDVIADYIAGKIDSSIMSNQIIIEHKIKETENQLNTVIGKTDELFGKLGDKISGKMLSTGKSVEQSWLQNLLSAYCTDFSALVRTSAGGKMAWMEFVRKAVFNLLWESLLVAALGGPIGFVLIAFIEWMQMKSGKEGMVVKILTETKDATMKNLASELETQIGVIKSDLSGKMEEAKEKNCHDSRLKLADEKTRLSQLISNLNNIEFDAGKEKKRCENILKAIVTASSVCYKKLFGKDLTGSELRNL